MIGWTRLDLTSRTGRPPADMLVALRQTPSAGEAEYDIGRFNLARRKLWWHGRTRIEDPVQMKKHGPLWWCLMPEFDGP